MNSSACSVSTREKNTTGDEEIELLSTVAGQAAGAIQNSQLYEQTRDQAVELERANRIKNEFLNVVSHELRTPVNVIMGYTTMVKDRMMGELNLEQEGALGKVAVCAKDLLAMINDILQVATIEGRGLSVLRTKFNLSALVDVLRATCEIPPAKEVALHWDYPSKLPAVNTDNEKLTQILQNLINNAIKFTEKGRITVSVRPLREEEGVEFIVQDSGIGISDGILPTVFEKFHQADSSTTRNHNGVGLGLYITKKLTELLGGSITVQSELGKGSAFTVRLPCIASDEDNAFITEPLNCTGAPTGAISARPPTRE
jgi:signal transduction histidine kinase